MPSGSRPPDLPVCHSLSASEQTEDAHALQCDTFLSACSPEAFLIHPTKQERRTSSGTSGLRLGCHDQDTERDAVELGCQQLEKHKPCWQITEWLVSKPADEPLIKLHADSSLLDFRKNNSRSVHNWWRLEI